MYFVTAMEVNPLSIQPVLDSRCFGYFEELKQAIQAIEENWGDMHEDNFTHIVIENIPQGIHPISEDNEVWFGWSNWNGGHWKRLDYKPFWSDHIVNWSLG